MQIGIVPRDLDRSIAFYRDVMGFSYTGARPVIEGRTLHLFDVDGGVLKLLEQAPDAPPPSAHSPGGGFQHATGVRWMTFDVDDLDAIVARYLVHHAGTARSAPPFQMPVSELRPGLRVCILEDCDGNAVELVERHPA